MHLQMPTSDTVKKGFPTITRVSWETGTEQEEKDGRWGNLWEAKAANVIPEARP